MVSAIYPCPHTRNCPVRNRVRTIQFLRKSSTRSVLSFNFSHQPTTNWYNRWVHTETQGLNKITFTTFTLSQKTWEICGQRNITTRRYYDHDDENSYSYDTLWLLSWPLWNIFVNLNWCSTYYEALIVNSLEMLPFRQIMRYTSPIFWSQSKKTPWNFYG